uniref:DUF2164 domain-containing protein n=1 Tax=Acidobacterium capsulatum TaxID=33075 RepID=A0A7V4XSS4_9BACT
MVVELDKATPAEAIASIRRYSEANLPEPLAELGAGLLLNFLLEEIGPAIYNRAIADAQARMQQRVADLSGELYAEEFPYWRKVATGQKKRR